MKTFWDRFKFAFIQGSMITSVGYFSERLHIRDVSYFCNSLGEHPVNSSKELDGWIDGWMDGWMDELCHFQQYFIHDTVTEGQL